VPVGANPAALLPAPVARARDGTFAICDITRYVPRSGSHPAPLSGLRIGRWRPCHRPSVSPLLQTLPESADLFCAHALSCPYPAAAATVAASVLCVVCYHMIYAICPGRPPVCGFKRFVVGRPSCLPSCRLGWCWSVQLWRARDGQTSASPSLACRRPRADQRKVPSNESKRGVKPTHTEPQPDTAGGKHHRGETAQGGNSTGGKQHTRKPTRQLVLTRAEIVSYMPSMYVCSMYVCMSGLHYTRGDGLHNV